MALHKIETIILTDMKASGHWTTYMCMFTKTFLELGYRVKVLFPNHGYVRAWVADHYPEYLSQAEFFNITSFDKKPPAITKWKPLFVFRLFLFRRLYQEIKKNTSREERKKSLLFIAWYKYFVMYTPPRLVKFKKWVFKIQTILMNAIFPIRWSTLSWHYDDPMEQQVGVMDSKYCQSVCVFIQKNPKPMSETINKTIYSIPDFSEIVSNPAKHQISEEIKEKAQGRHIIGLVGGLYKRKGLLNLIRLAECLDERNYYFVVVGEVGWVSYQHNEIEQIKNFAERDNVFHHFEYIEGEDQLCAIIQTFSILYASYPFHKGTSGMLFKSATLKVPMLVSKGHMLHKLANQYRLGLAVNYGSLEEYKAAIVELVKRKPEDFGFEEYLHDNHPDRLLDIFTTLVDEAQANCNRKTG